MAKRPKHVAVTEWNIQNSVALDGNPEPDLRKLLAFIFDVRLEPRTPSYSDTSTETSTKFMTYP
jgi:hypothetical protein